MSCVRREMLAVVRLKHTDDHDDDDGVDGETHEFRVCIFLRLGTLSGLV